MSEIGFTTLFRLPPIVKFTFAQICSSADVLENYVALDRRFVDNKPSLIYTEIRLNFCLKILTRHFIFIVNELIRL